MPKRIILALDELNLNQSLALVSKIGHRLSGVKTHNHFKTHDSAAVQQILAAGAEMIWDDAKLYDIPNVVARGVRDIMDAGVSIISVHASGGVEMMRAAVETAAVGSPAASIVAVTVLSSLDEARVRSAYRGRPIFEIALDLALQAKEAGVRGIVCSPQEVHMLSRVPDLENLDFFVAGIRPAGKPIDDQKRVGTPADVLKNGATHLVIGRPITLASDPVAAFEAIEYELAEAESGMTSAGRP